VSTTGGRHTKGVNLIDLVKTFRALHRAGQITAPPPEEARFLEERILVSSWYPIEDFWRLAQRVHAAMGGTDKVGHTMGEVGASAALQGVHRIFLKEGDPAATVRSIERIWSSYFDFGEVRVEGENPVYIRVEGYGDMPRVHGQILVGWIRKAVELAGGDPHTVRIDNAPWLGADGLVIAVHLGEGADGS
jgi:hypothetical protein